MDPRFLLVGLTALTLIGCNPNSDQISNLQIQLGDLRLQADNQSRQIALLQFQLHLQQQDTAVLDLTQKGYQAVETRNGKLLIASDRAEPYLDGHRLKLQIGNPNYAMVSKSPQSGVLDRPTQANKNRRRHRPVQIGKGSTSNGKSRFAKSHLTSRSLPSLLNRENVCACQLFLAGIEGKTLW